MKAKHIPRIDIHDRMELKNALPLRLEPRHDSGSARQRPANAKKDLGQHRAVEFPAAVSEKRAEAHDRPLLPQMRHSEAGCAGRSGRICRGNTGNKQEEVGNHFLLFCQNVYLHDIRNQEEYTQCCKHYTNQPGKQGYTANRAGEERVEVGNRIGEQNHIQTSDAHTGEN